MSYNGSGTFNINTTGQPVVAGTVITASAFNALTADLATGLTTAITKDGQTTTTARITFAQGLTSSLSTDSSSTSTGSIITAGGAGIAKALFVGTTANVAGAVTLQSTLGVNGITTFSAQPIFSSLTASSAVATDASKGLVSVTNTGTGNNVLATSPTLVTPILGTPQSGTLTNCTGLPTTALTGAITEANGGTGTTTGYYGFKNRIINGAMVFNQRGWSGNVTNNNEYTLDRFQGVSSVTSKFSVSQSTSVYPTGFNFSLLATSQSAYKVGSAEQFILKQNIEAYNTNDLNWGTANASAVTLSFWVRSSLTGTFGGSLFNSDGSRSYPFTYTISSANTWEQKTITIAGDTSGTWAGTNGVGITVSLGLGVGSTLSGTAGSWSGNYYSSATGATSVVGTNGATFYITGVQLEKGSTATSFDYRPYSAELAMCQRYYFSQGGSAANEMMGTGACITTGSSLIVIPFEVQMRTAPSFGSTGSFYVKNASANTNVSTTSFSLDVAGNQTASIIANSGTVVAGNGTVLFANGSTARLQWSAEL